MFTILLLYGALVKRYELPKSYWVMFGLADIFILAPIAAMMIFAYR